MDRTEFERIARETIDALPTPIRRKVDGVVIVIDDREPPRRGKLLLGLYEGVPITEWGRDQLVTLPDKITLFSRAIIESTETDEEIPQVIRETLWHEIAHFFGFEHDKIDEMEARWKAKRGER